MLMYSVSSCRCSPRTPTRTTTGVMKTWTPWRRLPSTSWRRGWRGWTCSPWSWRKVPNTVKVHLKKPRVFCWQNWSKNSGHAEKCRAFIPRCSGHQVGDVNTRHFTFTRRSWKMNLGMMKPPTHISLLPTWTDLQTAFCPPACLLEAECISTERATRSASARHYAALIYS